jgi:hypothetical protein
VCPLSPPSAKPLNGGKAFKRKTKIAEESDNRGGTNWRQFTQGIPVVDASINVPYFFVWNVIENGAKKHFVRPKNLILVKFGGLKN